MAITLTTATGEGGTDVGLTLTATGCANNTDYRIKAVTPEGTGYVDATSDGSGNLTATFTPSLPGSYTFEIRPKAEYAGTTTAAATATWIADTN